MLNEFFFAKNMLNELIQINYIFLNKHIIIVTLYITRFKKFTKYLDSLLLLIFYFMYHAKKMFYKTNFYRIFKIVYINPNE